MIVEFDQENFKDLCAELCRMEPVFESIAAAYGYPPLWCRAPRFSTLLHIILEQQVSLASAQTAYNKLAERLVNISPEAVLCLSDDELKHCYFSRQKINYARHLCTAITTKKLIITDLHHLKNEEIVAQLTAIKGIGKWTATIYLMMCLNRVNCFPSGDVALIHSARFHFEKNKDFDNTALMELSEQWAPYKTLAAYFLWHAYLCRKNIIATTTFISPS